MKKLLLIIVTLSYQFIFGQNLTEYSTDFGLIGNVKSLEEKSYSLVFISGVDSSGKLIEQSKTSQHKIKSFNAKNILVEEINKDKNRKITYEYDANDALIDIKHNDNSLLNRRNNKIMSNHRKKLMTVNGNLEKDTLTSIPEQNEYNENKRVSKIYYKHKSFNNIKISVCDFFYENKNLESIKCYKENAELFSTKTYHYNNGKSIEKEVYTRNIDNVTQKTITKSFDENGILSKEITHHLIKNKVNITTTKIYKNYEIILDETLDSLNKLVRRERKTFYSNGLIKSNLINYARDGKVYENSKKYTYDKYDNIISIDEKYYEPTTSYTLTERYNYKYDKVGNWILKCFWRENHTLNERNPKSVTTRYISYYDTESNELISKEDALHFCDPRYTERLNELRKSVGKGPFVEEEKQ